MLSPSHLARVLRAALAELDAIAAEQAATAERAPTADDLLALGECDVSVRTLRSAIKAGTLPASKVGREYRVRRRDLASWLDARRVRPTPEQPREQSPADRAFERAVRAGQLRVVGGGR